LQSIWEYNHRVPSSSFPRSRFGFQFVELARRWRRALDSRLAQAGLTDATWAPLIHLHESGDGIQQKELAVRLGLDSSSLVRLLDILCTRGLIERREDAHDRRAKRICLTVQGRQAIRDIRRVLAKIEQEMLADLSDGDIAILSDAFAKISVRVQSILDTQHDHG
jgi:MarR family transcriptional regulator, transcriptional regulator for hemolysin